MNQGNEYMNHITLTTGHNRKSYRSEVFDETIVLITSWLEGAIKSGTNVSLPGEGLSNYTALVSEGDIGLAVTIFGHSNLIENGEPVPMITMSVVNDEQKRHEVWQLLNEPYMPPVASGTVCPELPYAGVSVWPTSILFLEAQEWLGDFERCVAWAWLTKQKIAKEASMNEAPENEAPTKNEFEYICVGKPLPNILQAEGPRLMMKPSGLSIVLNINNPDAYELNALANSKHQMKIGYTSHDRLGILILDFKGFSFDLPFDAGIENTEDIPDLGIKSDRDRILLSIISADSARSHKVIGIRHITMSPRVSRLVAEKIQMQVANPISKDTHDALLE